MCHSLNMFLFLEYACELIPWLLTAFRKNVVIIGKILLTKTSITKMEYTAVFINVIGSYYVSTALLLITIIQCIYLYLIMFILFINIISISTISTISVSICICTYVFVTDCASYCFSLLSIIIVIFVIVVIDMCVLLFIFVAHFLKCWC